MMHNQIIISIDNPRVQFIKGHCQQGKMMRILHSPVCDSESVTEN
uniref:Uncharacterized protein n=1 Tax=Rhizophora mucronata TaxID=61149 RepID=A0A2P2QWI6_RHIMU